MGVHELLEYLKNSPRMQKRIVHIESFPKKEATYGRLSSPLPDPLQQYLSINDFSLYSHQCSAIEHIRDGENIILTTPTASGKSLSFNLPVFERLSLNPAATALYLYPTKALANDQISPIREMEQATGIRLNSAIYDGDTPTHRRPQIRERSRIVVSNPYELHQILPWHHKWRRLFSGLHFVVIDEAHRYRGVFGSNIAFLIRRLKRIAALYGSKPRFILSTATIGNPEEFAGRLCGEPCTAVNRDGAPKGERHFILYNPYYDGFGEHSVHQETRDLFLTCIRHRQQTLCFTVSRKMAELITRWSRESLAEAPGIPAEAVCAYRAGYLPAERRNIEQGLKTGKLMGVVSTNALEVGIDVGTLDSVIISGYPGTMMAAWQQAGRAGRRSGASLAALVAFQGPLDQYFMNHPDQFFSGAREHAVIDLNNPYIMGGHLLCAAAEAPLPSGEASVYFGDRANEMLSSLDESCLVKETGDSFVYTGTERATEIIALNGLQGESFQVICNGRLLETLDQAQAFREAHPGAVLLNRGETYVVEDFSFEEKLIHAKKVDVDFYTKPLKSVEPSVIQVISRREKNGIQLCYGDVEIIERYTGYQIRRQDTLIRTESLVLPERKFTTRAFWFTVPEDVSGAVRKRGFDFAGGMHAVEHAMIAMMPIYVMCDRWDLGGFSTVWNPDMGGAAVMIYDGYEGGIGLSEKAYTIFSKLAKTTLELVSDCPCSGGCPACIFSPKCGNDNQPLDKAAAALILKELTMKFSIS